MKIYLHHALSFSYFVGKDVATALGYRNARKALLDHVDDEDKEDGVTIRDSIGRKQKAVVINESGLYALILTRQIVVSGQGLQHDYLGGDRNESL